MTWPAWAGDDTHRNGDPMTDRRAHLLRRVPTLLAAVLLSLTVLPLQAVLAGPATAAGTATVTGRVTDRAGTPLAGIHVAASVGNAYTDVVTGSDGRYTLTSPTGTASLTARDDSRAHETGYWNGTTSVPDYTTFTLGDGTTTADFSLADQHTITGVATDTAGTPIPDVGYTVEYRRPDGTWQSPQLGPLLTDADGTFVWRTAVGTTYRFCFFDDYYGSAYGSEQTQPDRPLRYTNRCWQNGTTIAAATDIPVTASSPLDQRFTLALATAGKPLKPTEPFVHGSATVGGTLRVDTGRWQPDGVTFTYAWVWYDDAGEHTIAGATGPTYTPTADDTGRSLSAIVTGSLSGYKSAPQGAYAGTVGDPVPSASAPLSITGSGVVGSPLDTDHGTVTPGPATSSLIWLVDGLVVAQGYTGHTSYTPTAADIGKQVTVREITSSSAGGYGELHEYAVGPVVRGTLTAPTPTISGTTKVGSTLTAVPGTWGPSPVTLTYQWYRSGTAISGATAKTYRVVAADQGKALSVRVTGTKTGYTSTYRDSARTGTIP